MAQLYEKVELRDEGELSKIQQLLQDALDGRAKGAAGSELTEEGRLELATVSAGFVEQLRQFVVFAEEGEGVGAAAASGATRTQLTPAGAASLGLRSPLLKPLSPPPADAEVQRLEEEVTAASLRVAELRTSMQARLQEQLAAKLAVCRPTAELEEEEQQQQGAAATEAQPGGQSQETAGVEGAEAAAQQAQEQADGAQQAAEAMAGGDGAAAAGDAALSPQPEDLQQRLLQATNRMPALRARLEQATDKLQRVVAAVAADISRPPPNTVEKAVLGKTPGRLPASAAKAAGTAAGAENEPRVSPLFQQALESGQISTRRRVARDVQPVPYSQQD